MELDKFIWKFVDKYHMLPALHGVYMDPEEEAAVATDGHAMLVCHELYDKDKADMIVFKDGHCVKNGDFVTTSDGRKKEKIEYPKWQTALPHEWRNRYKIKENDKYHYGFVYNDVKIDAWFKDRVSATVQLTKMKSLKFNASVQVSKRHSFWVAPRLAKMMVSYGLDRWHIGHQSRPAINERNNGDIMLVMPMLPYWEFDTQTPIEYGIHVDWSNDDELNYINKVIKDFDLPLL